MGYHSIKKNIIAHCGNNQINNQILLTVILHDIWSCSRPLNDYYGISAEGLGTAVV